VANKIHDMSEKLPQQIYKIATTNI